MWKPKREQRAAKLSSRGKEPEKEVHEFIDEWAAKSPHREANRLLDSRAAKRIIEAAKADFDFYCGFDPATAYFGLIEVKSTEHEYRLARDKVPQLPHLRKRAMCGGVCVVLVFHSTLKKWRLCEASWLGNSGDKGSWNIGHLHGWDTPEEALHAHYPEIF
jgi:hypothetical protein